MPTTVRTSEVLLAPLGPMMLKAPLRRILGAIRIIGRLIPG